MLALKFRLSEEEYFDYNYYTAWASPGRRNYRRWYYVKVFFFYSMVAGVYIFSRRSGQVETDIAVFTIIAAIYFLMVPWLIRKSIYRRVKQVLEKPENRNILEETEVELSDSGILEKDPESESRYRWDAIVKKAETPLSYLLYTNSYHAIVIPKRVVNNSTRKEELEGLMNEHLSLHSEFSGH